MPKAFRQRKISSSSSSEDETDNKKVEDGSESVNIKDKIEEIKFLQKQRIRTHGVDVYSLAIGESETTASSLITKQIENDPWKSRTGGLVDMKVILEKRGNEIVKNMHSTFAKETNQRDEDAEMQRFIEEQLRKKKEAEQQTDQKTSSEQDSSSVKKYKSPHDALFDVPQYLLENKSKHKSEETLSEQMLSGIPEVDLGIEEKIRNIEETERAKHKDLTSNTTITVSNRKKLNENSSVNFVQHKRFDESVINSDKNRLPQHKDTKPAKPEPVVGDAPKHELLQPHKRKDTDPHEKSKKHHGDSKKPKSETTEKASDDYCLEKFKKNMKFNRGNKIKIA